MIEILCRYISILMIFMFPVVAVLPVMYGVYFFVVRRKEDWRKNPFVWFDLLAPVVASIVWIIMVATITTDKSLSNLIEPFVAGAAYCVLWALRLLLFSRIATDKRKVAWNMLWIICVVIVSVALLTPCLPE